MSLAEEMLRLDFLTLREHTESSGDLFDARVQLSRIERSLEISQLATVRRGSELVAYVMLQPHEADSWFVSAFVTHPEHRAAPVLMEMFRKVWIIVQRLGITHLVSHVYKTNSRSVAFHQRLGFEAVRVSDKAIEYIASTSDLMANRAVNRTAGKLRLPVPSALRAPAAGYVER